MHRDELTRRIILRFDGLYEVDHLLLRFDRCDVSYKVHYHVHALSGDNRSLLAEGNILQYQCEQLSSNTYYEANNNAFGKQSQSLNGYGISLSVKTRYLSVDLNYSLTGILSHTDEAGNLQAEILPEAYGQAVEETKSCEPHVDFTFVKE